MRDKLISNKSILMKQLKETGRLEKFRKKYIPTEEEVKTVTPKLMCIDGEYWWLATDNKKYRVQENGFYYKDGEWKLIYTF